MKKFILVLIALLTLFSFSACNSSKPSDGGNGGGNEPAEVKWPTTPVSLIVAAKAGGGNDLTARALLEGLADYGNFGVVNNTDGAGAVAFEQVKSTDPKLVNNLLYYNSGIYTAYWTGVTDINPIEDLTPIFTMTNTSTSYYLIVPKNSPFNTLEDLVNYAKEHPGELKCGANIGDLAHTYIGSAQKILGIDWSYASTGSDADRIGLIMGNNLDVTAINAVQLQQYYDADEVKVLCCIHNRSALVNEKLGAVPTLEELGYENVPLLISHVVFGPKDMDEAVARKINEIFNDVTSREGFIKTMAEMTATYESAGDLEACRAAMEADFNTFGEVCKELGLSK